MKTKVSIIVPVYNVENYIDGCIKSLVSQTYDNIEIILVNDGSTDNSQDICDNYSKIDYRIKTVNKSNGGLSSARNAGIGVAHGDYIMFVDGDDYLAENAVEYLVGINEKYNADIVQFDYFETEKEYHKHSAIPETDTIFITDLHEIFKKLYEIGGSAASACTKLYKTHLFKDFRFKEGIIHEDEHMCTHMLPNVKSILYTNIKLYNYVMRNGSIIKSSFSTKKLDRIYVSQDRIEQLKLLKFDDLLQLENNRLFMTLITLWCEAKGAKDIDANKTISSKFKEFVKYNCITLGGKFRLIHSMCKLNIDFIYLYYFYKKVTGRV